jgi:hypothetical protein
MKSHVHYEASFEHFLRARQATYVTVDEAKRATFRDAKVKSFDFILYSAKRVNWLVDVKGRRVATRGANTRGDFQNWVTQEDLDGLAEWQIVFGEGFEGLLVFAYWLDAEAPPLPDLVHEFRDCRYVFAGIALSDYSQHARVRSPKWGTVSLPRREFAALVRPISDFL